MHRSDPATPPSLRIDDCSYGAFRTRLLPSRTRSESAQRRIERLSTLTARGSRPKDAIVGSLARSQIKQSGVFSHANHESCSAAVPSRATAGLAAGANDAGMAVAVRPSSVRHARIGRRPLRRRTAAAPGQSPRQGTTCPVHTSDTDRRRARLALMPLINSLSIGNRLSSFTRFRLTEVT
jgi:hypothetical protein